MISNQQTATSDSASSWCRRTFLFRLATMYCDGYKDHKLARTLFWLILVKVAILLLVFKLWLMPNYLNERYDTDEEKASSVRNSLIERK